MTKNDESEQFSLSISDVGLQEPLLSGQVISSSVGDEKESNIGKVASFYLTNTDRFYSRSRELFYQVIQFFAALTLMYLYAGPTRKSTADKSEFEQVITMMATLASSLVLTYVVSDTFFIDRQNRQAKKQLNALVAMPTPQEEIRNDCCIATGACFASWPYTLVGIQYPIIKSLGFVAIYAGILQFDNTVLHFLPILLALTDRIYGYPCHLIKSLFTWLKQLRMNDGDLLQHFLMQQEEREYKKIISVLVDRLGLKKQEIVSDVFTRHRSKFILRNMAPFEFNESDGGTNILKSILATSDEHKPLISKPKWNIMSNKAFTLLKKFIHLFGALWIDLTFLGYFAGPVNTVQSFTKTLKLYQQILLLAVLALPSDYLLLVLMSFIGGNATTRILDYFVESFTKRQLLLAPEIKLYPIAFFLYILPILPLTWYSPGSAPQVIKDNLGTGTDLLESLAENSRWGIRFLAAITFVDFFILIARKVATYSSGDRNKQKFVRFTQNYDNMLTTLRSLKTDAIKADLRFEKHDDFTSPKLTRSDVKNLFGIRKSEMLKEYKEKTLEQRLQARLTSELRPYTSLLFIYPNKRRVQRILKEKQQQNDLSFVA